MNKKSCDCELVKGNRTKNQHFISQVKQKLNSTNPKATRRQRKIYKFQIADRETFTAKLVGDPKIERNLAGYDLFTYKIIDESSRHNFEELFQKYEDKIEFNTKIIENSDDNIELANATNDLLIAKMMNFVRNPFCIQKTINNFGAILKYVPISGT
ncbi:hypothetical protein AAEX28_01050 [Lentisphaerota bacterium WC36G]|nr:hypothetical protein LJT99_03930 [Lentisphaerae bacterium WC36]